MFRNFQPETLENIRHYVNDMKRRKEGRNQEINKEREEWRQRGRRERRSE
jgi:hypothetical protein